jgi:hypothetical protein
MSNLFNKFFTSISSQSDSSEEDCQRFINKHFADLKSSASFSAGNEFRFSPVSVEFVSSIIKKLDNSSSPGVSGINTAILKLAPAQLVPVYCSIFNSCLTTNQIPTDWKSALVTPLFKNKGVNTDPSNYRGISVIPPLAKAFEKVLCFQITDYLNSHKILYRGQHGFRKLHSCETALHELISDINSSRDKKLNSLLFFIDYSKAFDTVDSRLLLQKLMHYGFGNSAIQLLVDYFKDRYQQTKVQGCLSEKANITLGVPQGSCLGPLLFLIFINDLPFLLDDLSCKLFADDTTIYTSDSDVSSLTSRFQKKIEPLELWCKYNKMDINWKKTYVMFICSKEIETPTSIILNKVPVEVVKEFKLLGVTIDSKLDFGQYVSDTCSKVYTRLCSIKNLFYLSTSVKVQFFKTFILPHFDYCSSLYVYFPKQAIRRLSKSYYLCLSKLLKFHHSPLCDSSGSANVLNDKLKKYGLLTFQHRLVLRIFTFAYKLTYFNSLGEAVPSELGSCLVRNSTINSHGYNLRNSNDIHINYSEGKYGNLTFGYIFPRIISLLSITTKYSSNASPAAFVTKLKSSINQVFSNIMSRVMNQTDTFSIISKTLLLN